MAPTTQRDGRPAEPEIKACPSSPCVEGALVIGVRTGAGRLAYVQPPTHVDAAFVARAREQGRPESRFRFSLPCMESGCSQWNGSACGLVDLLLDDPPAPPEFDLRAAPGADAAAPERTRLPNCSIRSSCRWYFQHGAGACAVCPQVVADCGGTETYTSLRLAAGHDDPRLAAPADHHLGALGAVTGRGERDEHPVPDAIAVPLHAV